MEEIHVDTRADLTLSTYENNVLTSPPGGVTVDVVSLDTGTAVVSGASATQIEEGKFKFSIGPSNLTNDPDEFRIYWKYEFGGESFERRELLRVVVPYLSITKAKELWLPNETIANISDMERRVRYVIESFCGQSFDYRIDRTRVVYGRGNNFLDLPQRLFKLASVKRGIDNPNTQGNESYDISNYVAIDRDFPWFIRRNDYVDGIIRADVGDLFGPGPFFKSGKIYQVRGDWGWEDLPPEVNKAAEILIQDYFCSDAKYREKYIDNIRSADWRMEFTKTGDQTTGNADADMMLTEFTDPGVVIV